MNVGIIGAGRIGQLHAQNIMCMYNVHIRSIADPYMTTETSEWANSIGIPNILLDYKTILEDKAIDAVLICSSTDTHAHISLEAIAANKHVFCEKPIDHDLKKIRQVLCALEKSPVKYQVGFQRRFDHNFRAVRQAVEQGCIGNMYMVKITSRDPTPPPIPYIKVSGGLFLDMMIHDFDMVRYLSGADVVEIYANAANLVDPAIGAAGDVDTAVVTLRLNNGAIGLIDNCRHAAFGHDQRAEVLGSKGAIQSFNDKASTAVLSDEHGEHAEKPLLFFLQRYMQAYRNEVLSFIRAIEADTEPEITANDGLQSVLIGLAAKKSLQEHRPVKIEEIDKLGG
ncbi:MAG TPA: inositol 2-dehydrogenase [Ruminiclostridium sp.]|nr:inositol 2-dehydrogenase [Ruminiclostridium sp.]